MGNELAEQVAAADPEAAARTRALRIWLRENGRWSVPHESTGGPIYVTLMILAVEGTSRESTATR
jgi:hypothetical protein